MDRFLKKVEKTAIYRPGERPRIGSRKISRSRRGKAFFFYLIIFVGFCCAAPFSAPVSTALRDSKASPSPPAAGRPCVWTGVEKIVAVGDLHGDFESFRLILGPKGTKLIDENDHWVGGKTHLVQTGDVMDRGDDAKEIFKLIRCLEKESVAAGGMVHFLIGNHEELNILNRSFRYNYVTLKQFKDFLPNDYVESKEAKFKQKAGNGGDTTEMWKELLNNGDAQLYYARTFNKDYGKWIAEHNAVIKINDTVFLHAGFSEAFSNWKLETINSILTKELKACIDDIAYRGEPVSVFNSRIVYQSNGPLWYRDLVSSDEALMQDEFNKILSNLGAKFMVVAHTPIQSAVALKYMKRFEGRLFMIDTSISGSQGLGGTPSALIITNGQFDVWSPDDRAPRSERTANGINPSAGRKVNHEKDRSGDDVRLGLRLPREGSPGF